MTRGELDGAVRRALNIFDEWVELTGALAPGTSYYYEMQGCIVDAVHCGAQAGTEDYRRLEDEKPIVPQVRAAIKAGKLTRDGRRKKVGSATVLDAERADGTRRSAAQE
jgi:hypothetical protein